ncbi:MAG: hypothetical protein EZS28_017647 [Streblomastix strix]|uniref:Uncharacterized protein n=1 Tax=Streblomastix strix TaxID=222440 RepID=A0A5J4VVT9_9EUKA|nr:MAG: hypothetical protein EZS28_017647 [Streblomastix strix]
MAASFCWLNWPLHGPAYKTVSENFQYVGFSIIWFDNTMLFAITIIMGVLIIALMVGVTICTLLNKRVLSAPPIFSKIVNIGVVLMSGIFYIPCVNVFIGSLMCYTVAKDPLSAATITCGNVMRHLILRVGLFFLVVAISFTIIIRLFIFSHDHKKGGIFTLQTGLFFTILQIGSTVVQIIGLDLRIQKMIIALVGTIIYAAIVLYPLILQLYFNPQGNTIWSLVMTTTFVFYFIGIICTILDTDKVWVLATVWILFIILFILLPILVGYLTYKRGISLWAMREDQEVPQTSDKFDALLLQQDILMDFALVNQQLQQNKKQNQNLQIFFPEQKFLRSTAIFRTPSTSTKHNTDQEQNEQHLQNNDTDRVRSLSPEREVIPLQSEQQQLPAILPKVIVKLECTTGEYGETIIKNPDGYNKTNESTNLNQQQKQQYAKRLKSASKPKKNKSIFAIENSIKFLCIKLLRKNPQALLLAENLVAQGQKRFPSESHMWMIIALYR